VDEAEPVIGPESGIPVDELLALYEAVGWSAYTDSPGLLQAGCRVVLRGDRAPGREAGRPTW
jgi:hypothetical protein